MQINLENVRKFLCPFIGLSFILLFLMIPNSYADTMAYWVADAYNHGSSTGFMHSVTLTDVEIDPLNTNWIAWHDQTTPDNVNGQEYVGDYGNWLGVDDYFYLTITAPDNATLRLLMDHNNAYGGYSGTQAVIYGSAADAPNVTRTTGYSWPPPWNWNIDEVGAFNAFFDTKGAGSYDFNFELYNGYYGSGGHPTIYLLVDTIHSEPVPEPTTMVLLGLGLAGLVGFRKKFRKS